MSKYEIVGKVPKPSQWTHEELLSDKYLEGLYAAMNGFQRLERWCMEVGRVPSEYRVEILELLGDAPAQVHHALRAAPMTPGKDEEAGR